MDQPDRRETDGTAPSPSRAAGHGGRAVAGAAPGVAASGIAASGADAWRAIWRQLRPVIVVAMAFSAIVNILMLTGSVYMLQVYDRVLSSGSVQTLVALFAIVVVLHIFLGFFDFLRTRLMARAAVRMDLALGPAAFRAWVAAGVPGHAAAADPDGAGREAPTSRPLTDLDVLRSFLSSPAVTGLMDAPWVPIFITVMFLIHPLLGWLTLAGAALVAGIAVTGRLLTRTPIRDAMAGEAAARDFAQTGRQGAETILAMGMLPAVAARWRALQTTALAAGQRGADPSDAFAAGTRAFRLLLQSAILTMGAYLVLANQISAGMIIAASILSGRALAPIDQVVGQWRLIGQAAESRRRLKAFFAGLPPEPQRITLPDPTGRIVATRLTKFAPGQPRTEASRILAQVSFALEPGDGMGVIGNSAAGKSTLARLIVGAWTPDAGEIRLDGATPQQWDPAALGRHIGYLPQALDLMPGTVRDIIARFDPAAPDPAVIEAARAVGVHEMILALPEGYATRVGQGPGEVPLSGGQRQRLGLARAVFGWPKLVVLDEPNANLDVAGDEALSAAITALRRRGSVVVVMAHRPSAIAAVNKLLILHAGRVAQFGDKDSVLAAANRPAGNATAVAAAGSGPAAQQPHPAPQPGPAAGVIGLTATLPTSANLGAGGPGPAPRPVAARRGRAATALRPSDPQPAAVVPLARPDGESAP